MIRHCEVSIVDYKKGKVKVTFDDLGTQSEWLKVLQGRVLGVKNYSMPSVKEKGLALNVDNSDTGYYLGGGYSAVNSIPLASEKGKTITSYSDGTCFLYDENCSKLYIDCKKNIEIISPKISIEGDVTIKGNLKVEKGITANEDIKAGDISLKNHLTKGVIPGSGKSGKPE